MLKQRIITALILAPLAVWAILGLSHEMFRGLLMVVAAMAAWEWTRLLGWHSMTSRAVYVFAVLAIIVSLEVQLRNQLDVNAVLLVALCWWLLSLSMIMRYPAGSEFWRNNAFARAIAGI